MLGLSLDLKRIDAAFAVCLFFAISLQAIIPAARLTYFAPFLIVCCYKTSLKRCLWMAFLCGIIVDLLSSYTRFGLYSLNYCTTLALLYPQRRNFFADSISTLPLMTFLFALISTLLMAIILYSIEMRSVFSWTWTFTDLLLMPAVDGFYAFVVFILPALLFGKRRRSGKDYFLLR